jgi:hypothetical protein
MEVLIPDLFFPPLPPTVNITVNPGVIWNSRQNDQVRNMPT